MTDDIAARLRDCDCVPHGEICREAADEIERLRGDRETMLSLLGTIADIREAAGVGDLVMLGELATKIKEMRDDNAKLRATIRTQQDRIEQSVRDNDRTIHLCAARYHRLQTIRYLVVKHGVVEPLRHDILRQTDTLD